MVIRHRQELQGAVPIFTAGRKPTAPKPSEVASAARKTPFLKEYAVRIEGKEGAISITPRALVANALAHALVDGLLVSKLVVEGSPPIRLNLDPGTYFFYLNYAAGGRFGRMEGRWLGRFVGETGRLACFVLGVEVKQLVTFGVHDRSAHERPSVSVHGIADGFGRLAADDGWIEYQVSWEPVGVACITTTVCSPGT